jgi:type II secretory pathway component GspD/PulD (secretin)
LRADRENNALLAVAAPAVIEKIGRDLALLDTPRAQFEVRAQAWEVASTREFNQSLALTRSIGLDSQTLDLGEGTAGIRIESGQTDRLSATLNALRTRGRAKLVASPFVTALSGQRGTLFLGQTRYIRILQNRSGGQTAQALPLQIGTTLSVTPRGGNVGDDVLLDIAPRVSTVDEIEADTGLPTLGIREASALVRVRNGHSLVLAGLDFESDSRVSRRSLPIFPSRRDAREQRALIVIVSVRRLQFPSAT